MGFTTGLLGGFTLTATVLYLSITYHRQNRLTQAVKIRQSSLILGNVIDPQPVRTTIPPRVVEAGLWETAKDKWNAQLERGLRAVYGWDWDATRDSAEETVGGLYKRAFEKAREAVPDPPK